MTTIAKSIDDILGHEYDWLASDANGFVALLSTAGGGAVPIEFLKNTDAHDAAIDAILALPMATQALFAPDLEPHLKNTWRMVAERGLFAFDSDPFGGPYRQVAAPIVPIRVNALPSALRELIDSLSLKLVQFDRDSLITAEQVLATQTTNSAK